MKPLHKILVLLLVLGMLGASVVPAFARGLTGAIFTTNAGCTGTNVNQFNATTDVYLNGGPDRGARLPDGHYYVRVTDPSGGTVLGTSGSNTPVVVSEGKFKQCYKLWDLVATGGNKGFANTPNKGGVYKVWVSPDAGFAEAKTDNFKVSPPKATPPNKVRPAQVTPPGKGGPKSHSAPK
jgi:hypothetical protein